MVTLPKVVTWLPGKSVAATPQNLAATPQPPGCHPPATWLPGAENWLPAWLAAAGHLAGRTRPPGCRAGQGWLPGWLAGRPGWLPPRPGWLAGGAELWLLLYRSGTASYFIAVALPQLVCMPLTRGSSCRAACSSELC